MDSRGEAPPALALGASPGGRSLRAHMVLSPKGANPSDQGSIHVTSRNLSHLPKASPPNTVPLGTRASTREHGGQTRSVCNKGKPLAAGAGRSHVRAPPRSFPTAALRWALGWPHFTDEETEAQNCTMVPGLSARHGECGHDPACHCPPKGPQCPPAHGHDPAHHLQPQAPIVPHPDIESMAMTQPVTLDARLRGGS